MRNIYIVFMTVALAVLITAAFLVNEFYFGQYPQKVDKSITVKELVDMNAQEFVEMIKSHRLTEIISLGGGQDVDERYRIHRFHVIKNWPHREDIPYLLSIVNSTERCGTLFDLYYSFSYKINQTNKKVGWLALTLLKAIQNGEFYTNSDFDPFDGKEEVIAWARAEAEKMKNE